MKIVLATVILFISIYVGYQLSNTYKRRFFFIKELNKFNDSNFINLLGQKNKMIQLIDSKIDSCSNKKFISCLMDYKLSLINKVKFKLNNNDFTNEEKEVIENYFNSIGKNEYRAEKQNLESFSKHFSEFEKDLKDKFVKYSGIFLKLSFLFGCVVVILII